MRPESRFCRHRLCQGRADGLRDPHVSAKAHSQSRPHCQGRRCLRPSENLYGVFRAWAAPDQGNWRGLANAWVMFLCADEDSAPKKGRLPKSAQAASMVDRQDKAGQKSQKGPLMFCVGLGLQKAAPKSFEHRAARFPCVFPAPLKARRALPQTHASPIQPSWKSA